MCTDNEKIDTFVECNLAIRYLNKRGLNMYFWGRNSGEGNKTCIFTESDSGSRHGGHWRLRAWGDLAICKGCQFTLLLAF